MTDAKEQELADAADEAACKWREADRKRDEADRKLVEADRKWDEACRELREYRADKASEGNT